MYKIIDDNGTIYSSESLEEMFLAFDSMTMNLEDFKEAYSFSTEEAINIISEWKTDFFGNLQLVEVIKGN